MSEGNRGPGAKVSGAPPDYATLMARARALTPGLRERAAETERRRAMPPETVEDLRRTGLFRAFQPRRVGGSELDYVALVDLSAVLGEADASVAWVYGNLA